MASSKEDLMLVVAMLLPEEEEENQSKKERKQCWYDRGSIRKKNWRAVFISFFQSLLRTIQWLLRPTCEWTSSILAKLLIIFRKDFTDRLMRDCVKPAEMCCLAVRSLFSQSAQQHWLRALLVMPPCFESARNTRRASRFSKKFLMLMQLTHVNMLFMNFQNFVFNARLTVACKLL